MKEITKCQYCGSEELRIGYQINDGEMSTDYRGTKTTKIVSTICKNCGAILMSKVENPEIFDDDNRL